MPKAGRAAIAVVLLVATPVLGEPVRPRDNLFGVASPAPGVAVSVGNFGSIYATHDGGATWEARESGTKRPLFSVSFADERRGWIVGKSGAILHTADGGKTWTPQQGSIDPPKHLFKVTALDAQTAWAVGDWGAVMRTADGGATWVDRSLHGLAVERVESPDRALQTITDDVILYDVDFVDAQHGFIAGEFGTLLVTSDGGERWRQIPLPTEKTIFGLDFETPQRGWLVGIDGLILHTADGGATWETQNGIVGTGNIDDMTFVEAMANPGLYAVQVAGGHGAAVGDAGALFVTTDGGRNWRRRELPGEHRLAWMRDLCLFAADRRLLVGAAGAAVAVGDGGDPLPPG